MVGNIFTRINIEQFISETDYLWVSQIGNGNASFFAHLAHETPSSGGNNMPDMGTRTQIQLRKEKNQKIRGKSKPPSM
jgi:hypothetical protein